MTFACPTPPKDNQMKLKYLSLLSAAVVCLMTSVFAEDALPRGTWNEDFSASLELARQENVPMVLFWGNLSCTYCNRFRRACITTTDERLPEWTEKRPILMVCKDEAFGSTSPDYLAARDWITENSGKDAKTEWPYPVVGIYWRKADGSEIKAFFSGQDRKMAVSTPAGDLLGQFLGSLDQYIGIYSVGSSFVVGQTPCDRLEIVESTRSVDVPVTRSVLAADQVSVLCATFPDGQVQTNRLVWADGEYDRLLTVQVPDGAFRLGGEIALTLVDGEDSAPARSMIAMVEEPENSPKNPRWIGERTADTLAAGEWTMDLDVAKARSAAHGSPTLVLVGGSTWCPDCVKTDAYLVDTEPFKAWLAEADVSCVAIDVPKLPSGGRTSLLSYEATKVSDRYVNATVPAQERMQSGAGYLSRHGISLEDASAIAARNAFLVTNAVPAGLCRPEQMSDDNVETGVFKTGIPCLIILSPDGRTVGRLYQFNNISPADTSSVEAYVNRMREIVALSAELDEEDNADWRSTTTGLERQASVAASLSAMDLADYYRMDPLDFRGNGTISVSATAEAADPAFLDEKNVRLTLYRVDAEGAQPVAVQAVEGSLYHGLSLDVVLDAAAVGWYVAVRALDTSRAFAIDRPDLSITPYTLVSDIDYSKSYPAFQSAVTNVNEKTAGTLRLPVVRFGGGYSGVLSGRVSLDAEATTADPATYSWTDADVSWADGETDVKYVSLTILDDSLFDGERSIVLKLSDFAGDMLLPDAPDGTLTVSVAEDDKPAVGNLAIVGATPACAKTMTVFAVEGSSVEIDIARLGGAKGAVSTLVSSDYGTLSETELTWADNDRKADRRVTLTVPQLAELPASGNFKVTLAPTGITAKSAQKALTVQVVAADAPAFGTETVDWNMRRYVAVSNELTVTGWNGGKLTATKLSGSLPAGVTAKLVTDDAGARLVVAGVPTSAKACQAFYQLKEARPVEGTKRTVSVVGPAIRISCDVREIAVAAGAGESALNPSVAKSRTFSDLPVVDVENGHLIGLLTVTIPQTGKLSAKYRCREGQVSLSAKSWSACDEESGTLTSELTVSKKAYALRVMAAADGALSFELSGDPLVEGRVLTGTHSGLLWSRTDPASAYVGQYTVDCPLAQLVRGAEENVPTGDAWMTLKMTASAAASGKVTYAGCLPNGTSFSGSSVLTPAGENAVLPVLYRTTGDYFTALGELVADAAVLYQKDDHHALYAADGLAARWIHDEAKTDLAAFETTYGLYGAYYDPKEDLEACARTLERFQGVLLSFTASGIIDQVYATVEPEKPVLMSGVANPNAVKLSFTRSTGVARGTFKFRPEEASKDVTATWSGVLMPGWGGCGTCGAGEVFLPLVAGAFCYPSTISYETLSSGRTVLRNLSIKRGAAIALDEAEED